MARKTRPFRLSVVLSIIRRRHYARMEDINKILEFMTGDRLWDHQLLRVADECRPYLVRQFPQLSTRKMTSAIAELHRLLADKSGAEKKKVGEAWLAKQARKYGKTFAVKPLAAGVHKHKDPIMEVIDMMGGPDNVDVFFIGSLIGK